MVGKARGPARRSDPYSCRSRCESDGEKLGSDQRPFLSSLRSNGSPTSDQIVLSEREVLSSPRVLRGAGERRSKAFRSLFVARFWSHKRTWANHRGAESKRAGAMLHSPLLSGRIQEAERRTSRNQPRGETWRNPNCDPNRRLC